MSTALPIQAKSSDDVPLEQVDGAPSEPLASNRSLAIKGQLTFMPIHNGQSRGRRQCCRRYSGSTERANPPIRSVASAPGGTAGTLN
jgi:hypothetical protein